MTIYIELFLIENILINFCLLKLIYLTTKTKTTFFRLILSSTIGSIFSIFSIMLFNNIILLNITKFITATLMLLVSFKQSRKQFISNLILLFLYTYTFGGLITSLTSSTEFTPFGFIMKSSFSLELICLFIIVSTYIFELVLKHIKLKIKTNELIYNLTLTQKTNSININAYLDTGNFLQIDGQPVLVLDLDAYLKLTKTNLINFYTSNLNEISTQTVTGNKNIKTFTIDKIEIKNKTQKIILNNQIVAINTNNCFKNTNYQALLSPLFL